jgi:predicted restriction endonuclease
MNCIVCGQKINKGATKYCSTKCQHDSRTSLIIEKWKSGEISATRGQYAISKPVRDYLFRKYGNKCAWCGWNETNPYTGTIPLEVDHIDGNYKNNLEENLILLCPNCHSLTPTYKNLNKGNGRTSRKKYYNPHS